jgi:hypothetical protein
MTVARRRRMASIAGSELVYGGHGGLPAAGLDRRAFLQSISIQEVWRSGWTTSHFWPLFPGRLRILKSTMKMRISESRK